jgi:hypothetical protein
VLKESGGLTFRYLQYFPIELQKLNGEKTKKNFRQITVELKADELNFLKPLLLPQLLL